VRRYRRQSPFLVTYGHIGGYNEETSPCTKVPARQAQKGHHQSRDYRKHQSRVKSMELIPHLHDIIATQIHIPIMLIGVGLFLWGIFVICAEVRKEKA